MTQEEKTVLFLAGIALALVILLGKLVHLLKNPTAQPCAVGQIEDISGPNPKPPPYRDLSEQKKEVP